MAQTKNMKINRLVIVILVFLTSCLENNNSDKNETKNDSKENFHIYLLMGQSNMAGRGIIEPEDTLTHPRVFMLDKDTSWVLAKNPIHFDKSVAGTGLGLTFGKIMAEESPDVKIGLVPCAKGGSSINQWFPDSIHQATDSYPYNEMIAKSKKVLLEGSLKGIIWHQGEADTKSAVDISNYQEKFNTMIDLLKSDLGIQSVPIVIGEIGDFFTERRPLAGELNIVFEQMATQNDCMELVEADNLIHKGDSVHFDSNSYRILGKRYATKMNKVQAVCQTF